MTIKYQKSWTMTIAAVAVKAAEMFLGGDAALAQETNIYKEKIEQYGIKKIQETPQFPSVFDIVRGNQPPSLTAERMKAKILATRKARGLYKFRGMSFRSAIRNAQRKSIVSKSKYRNSLQPSQTPPQRHR